MRNQGIAGCAVRGRARLACSLGGVRGIAGGAVRVRRRSARSSLSNRGITGNATRGQGPRRL
eukprot:3217907-Alexandrium_andersonii.AAC.1